MPTIWRHVLSLLAIFVARQVLEFRSNARKLANLPGLRSLVSPVSLFGSLLPTSWINPGLSWQWNWRNKVYEQYGVHTMSVLPYLSGRPTLYTRSMDVARQVLSVKGQFEKPVETTAITLLWGRNIFAEDGSDWSRHRRIMNPAFGPASYNLVWDETGGLYREIMEAEGWTGKAELMLPATHDITTKVALLLISRCGFGTHIAWQTEDKSETSVIPFDQALSIVSSNSILRLITPRWMYKLPIKKLHDVETAYSSLAYTTSETNFMEKLIKTRREELSVGAEANDGRNDLFRVMLRASEGEGTLRMSDDELSGNTFVILFAGHETTARALDATMGFLALYEDIQEEVYREIREVAKNGKLSFTDIPKLAKLQACFLEGARLFPAVFMMLRDTTETVVLKTDEEDGHGGQIILEPGTRVAVDVVGLHYNAKYFPEPEEFRPSRWYNASESEMSMFSLGPRACIGRRFALTEGIAFLSNLLLGLFAVPYTSYLLLDWQLHIVLDPGETRAQWRARVMKGVSLMTLGVGTVPLRLTRRK
ncbi:cytochrome P450 [Mycena vitilis]|nr:cytochrome P450 [Mycena vitilis]